MGTESSEFEAITTSDCDVSVDLETLISSSNDNNNNNNNVIGDLGFVCNTMLTKLDLNLAFFSEKVSNLNNFVMHLSTMESEFETLILEKDHMMGFGLFEKGLEFDMLCGVLDSVIRELDEILESLHFGIVEARERVCSCTNLVDDFISVHDMLLDYEECLKQSEEMFTEIKIQSASFRRTLSSFKKTEIGEITKEGYKSLNVNAEIKLRTIEQQRYILKMLEQSLAKEMDLEKNLDDSREIQENLKLRISSLEQEIVHGEEETIDVWERLFEADNASEILMGISKDLLGRTGELNDALLSQTNAAEANSKDASDSEVVALRDRVSLLEKQLKDYEVQLLNVKSSSNEYQNLYDVACLEVKIKENHIVELKENVCNAESRAEIAEAKCKLLTEANSKLDEELTLLKSGGDMSMRVDLLEKQLKESNLQLQNTVASVEASKEKQSMLNSTIRDMENLIKDCKSKVSKAESRADNAEENCIILSESNAELNEELNIMTSRLEKVHVSLYREKEGKIAFAKDVRKRTRICKDMVKQLIIERERLKEQLSSLEIKNKILLAKLELTYQEA